LQKIAAVVLGVDCNKIVCRVKRIGECLWCVLLLEFD